MSDSPSNKHGGWITIVVMLFIASPGAVGFILKLTTDPAQAVALFVLFGILSLVGGHIVNVIRGVSKRREERHIEAIDARLDEWFSRYRGHYLELLKDKYWYFDVKGLSITVPYTLKLEKVFVDLSVKPETSLHVNPIGEATAPENTLEAGRHSIWYYLKSEKIRRNNMVILGAPGTGKTTLLKHITLILAGGRKERRQCDAPNRLPILLMLRNHAQAINTNADYSLLDAIQAGLPKDETVSVRWFTRRLRRGMFIIMLDGLDEVGDPDIRRKVAGWVERQMGHHGRNLFVTTSRPYGYVGNPLGGVHLVEVQPFTWPQVKEFVEGWYLETERIAAGSEVETRRIESLANSGSSDLLTRLRQNAALLKLTVNPLLLTMITIVHRYRGSLPGSRVQLYQEICEAFLGKRQEARGIEYDLSPQQKQTVLEPLAYHMMDQRIREISLEEASEVIQNDLTEVAPSYTPLKFIKMVEDTSGLFLENEPGEYGFAHLTFQEFLAAVYLENTGKGGVLAKYVGDSWWHETILLYAARSDASPILAACIEHADEVATLKLAVECGREAKRIQPAIRKRFDDMLNQLIDDPADEHHKLAAQALLEIRLKNLNQIGDDVFIDSTLITHAEYQLFLDDKPQHRPLHWSVDTFPQGTGRSPIIGVTRMQARTFCRWLADRDLPSIWFYRLPSESEADDNCQTGYWLDERGAYKGTQTIYNVAEIELVKQIGEDVTDYSATHTYRHHEYDLKTISLGAFILKHSRDLDLVVDSARSRNLVLDLDIAFATARDLDLAVDSARSRNLVLDLDIAFATARDLDLDRSRAVALVRDRSRDIALARASAVDRPSALARAVTRDRSRARALARALARSVENDLAIDIDIDLAIDIDLTFLIAHPIAHAIDRDLARSVENDLAVALARAVDSDLVRAIAVARDLARDLTRDLAIAVARDLARDLVRAIAVARDLARDNRVLMYHLEALSESSRAIYYILVNRSTYRKLNRVYQQVVLRRNIRYSILESIGRFVKFWIKANQITQRKQKDQVINIIKNAIEEYINLYCQLTIIEGRVKGKLEAVEGIRIVRERMTDN